VGALAALPWLAELRMCGSHAVAAGEGALDTLMGAAERLQRMDLEWCFAMGERETQALPATPNLSPNPHPNHNPTICAIFDA